MPLTMMEVPTRMVAMASEACWAYHFACLFDDTEQAVRLPRTHVTGPSVESHLPKCGFACGIRVEGAALSASGVAEFIRARIRHHAGRPHIG